MDLTNREMAIQLYKKQKEEDEERDPATREYYKARTRRERLEPHKERMKAEYDAAEKEEHEKYLEFLKTPKQMPFLGGKYLKKNKKHLKTKKTKKTKKIKMKKSKKSKKSKKK